MSRLTFDPRTLSWIKDEVLAVLEPAEKVLGALDRDPQRDKTLADVADTAHRIGGAVEIIGIRGAAMLAEELEATLRGMAAGTIALNDDHLEVVLRALLQLPAYLDQLYHGHRDIPLVLLPLLNDLRAVQDAELLTERAFFSPDLSVCLPSGYQPGEATFDLQTTARRLRPGYLSALLGLIRGQDRRKQLKLIGGVISNFRAAARQDKVVQLWWVASGLVSSLYDGGLKDSVALKILLGRLDQQTRRLVDYGEEDLQANPPRELLKNLLYYIGQSRSSSSRVQELKRSFRLEGGLPDAGEVDRAREDLYGYNANLIANISEQILEELAAIKDLLDIAVHSKGGSTEGMEPVLEHMHTVADALGMMGLSRFAKAIHEFEVVLKPQIEAGAVLGEEDAMRLASTLVYIESSLCDLDAADNSSESLELSMSRAEFQELRKTVAAEIIKDMKAIRDHLEAWLIDMNSAHLSAVIGLLHMLEGAALLLQCEEQAGLMARLNDYFRTRCAGLEAPPPVTELDRMANVVVGIEHYFSSMLEQAVAPDLAVSLAEQSLRELGDAAVVDADQPVKSPGRAIPDSSGDEAVDAEGTERVLRVIDGSTGEERTHTVRDTDQEIADMFSEFGGETADQELVQVFLAEAEEVLNKIENDLRVWREDTSDHAQLFRLIRSFHTLKGAGRIIGATNIGVLSWAIEELLRRVADGPLAASDRMFGLLDQAVEGLRGLTLELKGGAAPAKVAVEQLITVARELRKS